MEINSSFYAPPRTEAVKGWASRTGPKFKFAFKAPRLITHILKLGEGSTEAAGKFSKNLDLLGPRRGPILFQLPPFSKQDHSLLDEFLSQTTDVKDRVFEFRHQSWLEDSTFRLLEKHGTGFCVAETEDMQPVFKVTGGLAYFRLRLESYDIEGVDKWADKIQETSKGARESYVYLRHDESGENALLARRLSGKLST